MSKEKMDSVKTTAGNKSLKHQLPQTSKLRIEIKLLSDKAFIPVKAKRGSIGYDLAIPEDTVVPAYSRTVIPLQIAINLPHGIEGKIEPRSGFSSKGMEGYGTKTIETKLFGLLPWSKYKTGIQRFNADVIIGKIDPFYTDSVGVIICNNDVEFTLQRGTRIAQLSFYRVLSARFISVDELSCDSRGGGFGSTGTSTKSTAEIFIENMKAISKSTT